MTKEKVIIDDRITIKIYEDRIISLKKQRDHINNKIKKWEDKIEKIKR